MEAINNLERTIAGWFKDIPHLPLEFRKWLGDNVWWIVLIGVVLSVLALFPILMGLMVATGVGVAIGATGVYGTATGGLIGFAIIGTFLALASLGATAVLLGLAVSPLKAKKRKGWQLLFIVLIVGTVFSVAGNILSFNFGGFVGLISTALWTIVQAYLLFEIRSEFGHKVATKPVAAKSSAKATKA